MLAPPLVKQAFTVYGLSRTYKRCENFPFSFALLCETWSKNNTDCKTERLFLKIAIE